MDMKAIEAKIQKAKADKQRHEETKRRAEMSALRSDLELTKAERDKALAQVAELKNLFNDTSVVRDEYGRRLAGIVDAIDDWMHAVPKHSVVNTDKAGNRHRLVDYTVMPDLQTIINQFDVDEVHDISDDSDE